MKPNIVFLSPFFIAFFIACGIVPAGAEIVRDAPPLPVLKTGAWDSLKLKWDKPEQENNESGTPIGNGYFGAKFKGGVAREFAFLNDLTFWSKGPANNPDDPKRREAMLEARKFLAIGDLKGADAPAKKMWSKEGIANYTPIGSLILSFDHGDKATGYRRELDLDRAVATVSYTIDGVTYTRETFGSFPDRIIAMRLTASQPGKLGFTTSLEYPKPMEGHGASVASEGNNVLVMNCKAPAEKGWDPVKGMTAQVRIGITTEGGKVSAVDRSLRVEGATSATLYYADATSFNGFDKDPGTQGVDPAPITKKLVSAAGTKGYDLLIADHIKDYQSISRRLWTEINGEAPNKYALGLMYSRYDMIAASRTGQAPHNLQGLWNRGWNPTNQGAYFFNENVEKYYSLIEPANLADTSVPLWNFLENMAVRGAKTAKTDWGFNGWVMTHYSDIWCDASVKGGGNWWSIWPMGGAWVCQNLWEHYAFSLDPNFLKRAYPTLKGQAEFILDLLVADAKGRLAPSPSSSPENMFRLPGDDTMLGVTVGSACDLEITRQLFENVVNASRILKVDADFSAKLQKALDQLAPVQISANGSISEWSRKDTIEVEPHHRHVSPLVGVWPLDTLTAHGTPELFAAAKITLANRGTGGFHPDKAAMWARLGDGDRALKADDDFYTGNALVGRWTPKYAAYCEMLVQSHTGEIALLPALPSTWKSGRIDGIRARGGYQLSLEWKDGKLVKCRIDSPFGTTPVVRYEDQLLNLTTDSRVSLNLLTAS
ncbi:MAG: glycoside hydrolase family 95 protein [Luteolibacter sp.]